MVELIASVCDHIRRSMQLDAVVLSGGVFMNALLSSEANTRLKRDGFRVYRHRLVPPNDGGLSLGQLAIAAALAQGESAGGSRGAGKARWRDRGDESPAEGYLCRDRQFRLVEASHKARARDSERRRRCALESPEK